MGEIGVSVDTGSVKTVASVGAERSNIESRAKAINVNQRDSVRNVSAETTESEAAVLKRLSNVKLAITIDESADLPVIKIFDSESGEEIIQVPAEHSLNISKTIKAAVGAIFDKRA